METHHWLRECTQLAPERSRQTCVDKENVPSVRFWHVCLSIHQFPKQIGWARWGRPVGLDPMEWPKGPGPFARPTGPRPLGWPSGSAHWAWPIGFGSMILAIRPGPMARPIGLNPLRLAQWADPLSRSQWSGPFGPSPVSPAHLFCVLTYAQGFVLQVRWPVPRWLFQVLRLEPKRQGVHVTQIVQQPR